MFFLFACSMDVGQIILEAHYRRVAELKEMKLIENVVQIYGQNGATLFDIFSTFQVVHDRPLQKSLLKKSIMWVFIRDFNLCLFCYYGHSHYRISLNSNHQITHHIIF